MILYHGSINKFNQFEIKEDILRTRKENLVEGVGVYMADNMEFVKGYGNYIYKIDIDNKDISDFTNRKYILSIINKMENILNINFSSYFDIEDLILDVLEGWTQVTTLYKYITDILDSKESFYNDYSDLITYEDDCIFEKFKNVFLSITKNTFKYYSRDFKQNIYICKDKVEKLNIIDIVDIE